MVGLFSVREHFVLAVFGSAWEPVIVLLAIFAPIGAIRSVLTTTGSIYLAKGRTDLQLQWGIISNLLVVLSLCLGLQWGVVGVAGAFALSSILLLYPNFKIPFRLIELNIKDLISSLSGVFVCSLLMYASIVAIDVVLPITLPHSVSLALTVARGMFSYTFFTWAMNRKLFYEMLAMSGFIKG
jgi:PST family polysaccharide transporter